MNKTKQTHCGYVGIIGRPNVGKSTLMNYLVGQKLSITSRKPQTTRHRLLGIKTENEQQIIYVDTPGLHFDDKRAINRTMNKTAQYAINDVDVILWLVDALAWKKEDDFVLSLLKQAKRPIILAINKIDKLPEKDKLLPLIKTIHDQLPLVASVPISAKLGTQLTELEQKIIAHLPIGPHFFGPDDITDREQRFFFAEMIREKLFRTTSEELPYSTTVQIEQCKQKKGIWHIHALILVEREGQKRILIGKGGEKLKHVGRQARLDMEQMLQAKVFLQLWVKVRSGWTNDDDALAQLGYSDE